MELLEFQLEIMIVVLNAMNRLQLTRPNEKIHGIPIRGAQKPNKFYSDRDN